MHNLELLSEVLKKRKFEVEIFKTGQAAKDRACELIANGNVGFGSSMTLQEIGLLKELDKVANEVYSHVAGQAGESERKAFSADYYLTSANAVSMDGYIVNIDGTGNRVGATCFGPRNVIYFIGKNKITESLDAALLRAKETAVKIAKKFERKTPCVITGKCEECLSPGCVCSITTIHRKKPYGTNVYIVLINEELGL
jgi:hypothetical protein